ncbi:hypothetical protein ACFCXH_00610 [Streptomyces nojiriensis]|uniref:hypothetical protein n=1 Tax=Streptomyces nojiriensis TaxID=66374 RepID=UPI0035D86B45
MAEFLDDRTARLMDAWEPPERGPQGWQRPGVAAGTGEAVAQVYFPPVANGLDYLLSTAKHLGTGGQQGDVESALKYAILHLAAGVEVLLKARLQLEHWTLVFKDPGQATRKDLEKGTFVSCTPGETLQRLRNVAEVPISDKDAKALTQLAEHRNALQHYGLTGPSAAVLVVESGIAAVLDFLVRFLDEQLLPALTETERGAVQGKMTEIRSSLVWVKRFTTKRMQRLNADLEPLRSSTVECSDCRQFALVVGGREARCYFCWTERTIEDALLSHRIVVLGRPPALQAGDSGEVRRGEYCSTCGSYTVLHGVSTAASPEPMAPVALCFTCGDVSSAKPVCLGCERVFEPVRHELGCAECLRKASEQ